MFSERKERVMNEDRIAVWVACCAVLLVNNEITPISTLANNDPYPIFSTIYPYGYLLDATKNYLKGFVCEYEPAHLGITFSGYYQKANRGANYDRQPTFIGDIAGRWHMLGMVYGPVPPDQIATFTSSNLGMAKLAMFGPNGLNAITSATEEIGKEFVRTDSTENIGYFTVPIKYRKHGARFQVYFQPHEDFGVLIEGGYADIKQTLTDFIDLTPSFTETMLYAPQFSEKLIGQIQDLLMTSSSTRCIFKQQGIDKRSDIQNVCDFREGSFEDLRFKVWLRHIFVVNESAGCEWPEFLFIPFFFFEGSVSLATPRDRMRFLALPFGNDGHSSVAFTAGFHIDFYDTLEISFHGGATYFSSRNVHNYRLPNSKTQSSVFPFATDVDWKPGNNHHFAVMMHAYRFIGKLSAWVEFVFVNHDEDTIKLKNPDLNTIFNVTQQECATKFTSQFLTTAVNYEISPNMVLGFAVQWPLQQRNSYRSTTVIGTLKAEF